MHHKRWQKYGDVHTTHRVAEDALSRFERCVVKEREARAPGLDPCWIWVGAVDAASGYGVMYDGSRRRKVGAHRWAFGHFVALAPPGMHVHHRCEQKSCVNPAHLELLTPGEHFKRHGPRGWLARGPKTQCNHGHAMVGDNVYVNSQGARLCRTCQRARDKRRRERRRAGSVLSRP